MLKLFKKDQSDNTEFGEELYSNAEFARSLKRNTFASFTSLAAVVAVGIYVATVSGTPAPPPILDAKTGQFVTNYDQRVDQLSLRERTTFAVLAYKGLRARTGDADIDARELKEWGTAITANGATSWKALSDRWSDIGVIKPGVRRTVTVRDARPDRTNPYAYVIEAIESERVRSEYINTDEYRNDPRTRGDVSYLIRITMFFTDPAKDGFSRLDHITLHEEELVK